MDLETFKSRFVDEFATSRTRASIYAGFERYRAELGALGIDFELFLDGSFVSSKVDPGDVDLVCFADADAVDQLSEGAKQLLRTLVGGKLTRATHSCDAYFCPTVPETHPQYDDVRPQRKYWMGEFGFDRQDRPKGIVHHTIEQG
jgi:hypothetical protein